MNAPTMPPAARPEPAFSVRQLWELRRLLEQQRRFREEQLLQLRRTEALGLLEGVDLEISNSLINGARAAMHDVLDALERMDAGRYGRCRQCHTQIPLDRLEILPQLSLCMTCQRAERVRAA
jgi:DnaK suppressor protein